MVLEPKILKLMNVKKITLIAFAGLSIVLSSCHSSQELIEPQLSLKHLEKRQIEEVNLVTVQDQAISRKYNGDWRVASTIQQKYAAILGVLPQTIKNFTLYNFVEEWYGVRYRMGGDSKSGIDCSAFVRRLYENVFCTNLVRTAFEQFNTCQFVKSLDSVKEGDLVFFKTKGNRITHVGIYLMNDYFVHASSTRGVMISSLNEAYWVRRYAGAGIIKKDEGNM